MLWRSTYLHGTSAASTWLHHRWMDSTGFRAMRETGARSTAARVEEMIAYGLFLVPRFLVHWASGREKWLLPPLSYPSRAGGKLSGRWDSGLLAWRERKPVFLARHSTARRDVDGLCSRLLWSFTSPSWHLVELIDLRADTLLSLSLSPSRPFLSTK